MTSFSKLGIGLGLVFSCLLLAIVAELYYLLWWKKRISNREVEEDDGYSSNYAKGFFHLIFWKKPSFFRSNMTQDGVRDPEAPCQEPDQELGTSKDLPIKAFGEESAESEIMRLHNLCGPPRFLFTIKEETKEDLESDDGKSRGGRSRKGSRTRSLSDLMVTIDTPFLSPLASPRLKSPPVNVLDSYHHHGFNPLFESSVEAELSRLRSSPPPRFKFLRDAEAKLFRRLMEEAEKRASKNCVSVQDSSETKVSNSTMITEETEGSFLGFIVGKNKESEILHHLPQYHSSSSQDDPKLQMLQEDITHVCEAMLAFPIRFPWTRFYKGLEARKRIMSSLDLIMTERRRCSQGNQKDFMQCLLVEDERPGSDEAYRMTDTEIKDNILTMIIAGQDTTASAITWMVKYLGENQDVLDTLRAEQLHLAEKISPGPFLTLEDLAEMSYASKVVKESLRMASIVPWFPRLALQDCEIEGFKIKKGWNINVDAKSIHLDPNLYNGPNKFNPSRFNDDSKPYSFLAFGMGARTCLGMNMAKAMMLVFLHRLITTYKWKVIDSDSSIEKWALFSRLKSGCPVQVTRMDNRKDDTSAYGSH